MNRIHFTALIDLFKSIDFVETNRLKDVVLTTHLTETSKHLKINLNFNIFIDYRKVDKTDKH